MIKKELGPDALILSTRTIRNGKLGLLGKPMLEITAAIDADSPPAQRQGNEYQRFANPSTDRIPARKQKVGFRHIVDESVEDYLNDQNGAERYPNSRPGSSSTTQPHQESAPVPAKDHAIQGEVNELKELVKSLAGQITQLAQKENTKQITGGTALEVKEAASSAQHGTDSNHVDHILAMLNDRGINIETSRTITGVLQQRLTEPELSDSAQVMQTIITTIQDLIKVHPPLFAAGQTQQRIALVGPTGVGKTTTLAKIAASYLSKYSSSIALITIDTYRIAAVEQLKVYGEIMRLPVEVVITPEQLKQAILRHSDKELILIDTAGRSPRDSYCIDELSLFLPEQLQIDKHLVLSAGSRENELLSTIERFNSLGISNTIFTKIDECANIGILLNVQTKNTNPLSWVTNGQRVPEDLLEVSPQIVAKLIMSQHEGSLHD